MQHKRRDERRNKRRDEKRDERRDEKRDERRDEKRDERRRELPMRASYCALPMLAAGSHARPSSARGGTACWSSYMRMCKRSWHVTFVCLQYVNVFILVCISYYYTVIISI